MRGQICREDVLGLREDGPERRLLLSQFERLLATASTDGRAVVWIGSLVEIFTDVAPNLLVALAGSGSIPMTELDALNAIQNRGRTLESPTPMVAKLRKFHPTGSVAGMRLLLSHESEKRRVKHKVVPARTFSV